MVIFAVEGFEDCWPEAQPLLARHYREIATHQDIPLDVDVDAYRGLEQAGRLCIVTARDGGRLVGYAVFVVMPAPHYRGSLQAQQDVLYIAPSARGRLLGSRLVRFSEEVLRRRGVQVVFQHVKAQHPALGVLLRHHGYEGVETIYSKRLDRGTT